MTLITHAKRLLVCFAIVCAGGIGLASQVVSVVGLHLATGFLVAFLAHSAGLPIVRLFQLLSPVLCP